MRLFGKHVFMLKKCGSLNSEKNQNGTDIKEEL
jgi:hypothetical protein